ncbi:hypothetical protein [Lentzea waywayandensis]|uniref:hypothetical protein n=1 Tax=Lentzea waywayandensis TaxID=84724 RepID=UPI000B86CD6B|nr:hypothetical protein [Lentzea waywayandensis]
MRDDTTRFLCGAAHRDEEFAGSAIREYLVEATRSIPRSPGVNSGAVLRVVVRTRRKVRGGSLLVLAVVVLFAANGTLLVGWLVVASIVVLGIGARMAFTRPWRVTPRGPAVLGSIACAIALFFVLYKFMDELAASSEYCRPRYEMCEQESSGAVLATSISAIVLIFAALLVTKSFRRAGFRTCQGEEELRRNEWKFRELGHSNFAEAPALHPIEDDAEPDRGKS